MASFDEHYFANLFTVKPPERLNYNAIAGQNVMRLRTEQGLTKMAFSKMAGVSRPYLDKIEDGAANIPLSRLSDLADALCVPLFELLIPYEDAEQ